MFKNLFKLLPATTVYAHCDVPCGIYDPKAAQVAAETVLKMVQKIKEAPEPELDSDEAAVEYTNTIVRMVWTKEEHARICKEQLLILWTDYFKPEHLEKFPELHNTFWQAAKLCSKAKQTVDLEVAQNLVNAVNEIAEMFAESKK